MGRLQLGDLRQKAEELRRKLQGKLAEVDKLTGKTSERDRDAVRKRTQRTLDKIVVIPRCADPERRARLEQDNAAWLRYYFGDCGDYTEAVFWYDFVGNQHKMIDAIASAACGDGGDQAIADSRGGGKTTIARRLIIKFVLQGVLSFPVLFNATGKMAEDSLQAIKNDLELNQKLRADYPEVCVPISALEDTPNRAHFMVASGFRHDNGEPFEAARIRFIWSGQEVRMPNVPGSPAARALIATRGLDAAIVGLNKFGGRPDLALIDDADTEETIYSETQADKLADRIDRSIGGLGSQTKPIPRVMLCTIRNRNCVAWRFTDRKQKPSWRGLRFRMLANPPKHPSFWEEYVTLVQDDWREGTAKAERLYVDNRAAMDETVEGGSAVSNPFRKTAGELSGLQHYYNLVARLGQDAVDTEYNNNPPEDEDDAGRLILTSYHIQTNCISGLDRRIVPEGTLAVTIGADVKKDGLHWVAVAWDERGAGCIVDYDFFEFRTAGREAADCELLILEGLFNWQQTLEEHPFIGPATSEYPHGTPFYADLSLIDMGWKEESWNIQPVQVFCSQTGYGAFRPSKGMSPYRPGKPSRHVIVGDNWHWDAAQGVSFVNSDHWKLKVHEGFLADRGQPGVLTLFNQPHRDGRIHKTFHLSFSKHILAETWETRFVPGFRGARTGWWKSAKHNHYLDATYEAIAARSMLGISVLVEPPAIPIAPPPAPPEAPPPPPAGGYSRNRW